MKIVLTVGMALSLLVGVVRSAYAGCNVIPSAQKTFRGALGSTDRPFAGPGDFIELRVRPGVCDAASVGVSPTTANEVVAFVFSPPNGLQHIVVVATECADVPTTCAAVPVRCEDADEPGEPPDLAIVERDGERRLLVRFPDTDTDVSQPNDDETFAGPVRIAVKDRRLPVASLASCELLTTRCADLGPVSGLAACIDELYELDGTCRTTAALIDPTFGSFTALPPPNDYARVVSGSVDRVRVTTDVAGNVLMPVNWGGVLVPGSVPVPRLLRASTSQPAVGVSGGKIVIPGQSFLGSYTPEGAKLPPIFEPQLDPSASNEVTVFGSTDAPHTILRLARRSDTFGECDNALNRPCNDDSECPGGTCAAATCCTGLTTCPGAACSADTDCAIGEECGPSLFDFRTVYSNGGVGPIIVPQQSGAGICEDNPALVCPVPVADCGIQGPCVAYRADLEDPVPLEGLAATSELFTFAQRESDAERDLNDDGDEDDTVVVLRDRDTGLLLPIGATGEARAATEIRSGRFRFPAIAGESATVAFLESEPLEGAYGVQDKNGDGDSFDPILRIFRSDGTSAVDMLPGVNLAAEGAPAIDDRVVAVSNGMVFVRSSEVQRSQQRLQLVSVASAGGQITGGTPTGVGMALSSDGRLVAFVVESNSFFAGDLNNAPDIFVRDRDTDADGIYDEPGSVSTVLATYERTNTTTAAGASFYPRFSPDDQHLVFFSGATDLVVGDTNNRDDVFVRDLLANTTVRVSVDANGAEAMNGNSGDQIMTLSRDARYVAFSSRATNLVTPGTTGNQIFVHDRDFDGNSTFDEPGGMRNVLVSVAPDGSPGNGDSGVAAMTPDGRFVGFASAASNLVSGDTNGVVDVFVRDRDADGNGIFDEPGSGNTRTERVNVSTTGAQAPPGSVNALPWLSDDGRFVAFPSTAELVPGDTDFGGLQDAFVRDRVAGTTRLISANSAEGDSGGNSGVIGLSADGRYVGLGGIAQNLVPGSLPVGASSYLRDLVTGTTALAAYNPLTQQPNQAATIASELSRDGRFVGFATDDPMVASDTNGRADYYVYGPDLASGDISGDGVSDDTVLYAVDATVAPPANPVPLCPVTTASVAGGKVAFLRPEAAGQAPNLPLCPAGTPIPPAVGDPDLNGDGDTLDEVVHLWSGASVDNLHCAATAVSLSTDYLAAIVPVLSSTTLKLYPLSQPTPTSCGHGSWIDLLKPADDVQIVGNAVAFRTGNDGLMHLYDATTAPLILTEDLPHVTEDFVLGTTLLAYRANETKSNVDLNSDGDMADDVLLIYDLVAGAPAVGYGPQAVRPCPLEACDPRVPYRVFDNSVKFLTFECDQHGSEKSGCPNGGTDLNNDGDAADLVIQTFNVLKKERRVLGTVTTPQDGGIHNSAPDPMQGDPTTDTNGGTELFVSSGLCLENLKIACNPQDNQCGNAQSCRQTGGNPTVGTCHQDQGVCVDDADCPPKVKCAREAIVPASGDNDTDGIADALDNCVHTPNTDQEDVDKDGVGDACDKQVCGNGMIDLAEPCDGGLNATCPGMTPCLPDCTCDCSNSLNDPHAIVKLITKKGAGKLIAKLQLPVAGYNNESVGIRLSDTDSAIVSQHVGILSPKGSSTTAWEYKFKGDGLQKISINLLGGTLRVKIKAKKWFTFDGANRPAAETRLIFTLGNQCFAHGATKKIDDTP